MNFVLVEFTPECDEFGDRRKNVAVSHSELALKAFCKEKYNTNVLVGDERGANYDKYYKIIASTLEIVTI